MLTISHGHSRLVDTEKEPETFTGGLKIIPVYVRYIINQTKDHWTGQSACVCCPDVLPFCIHFDNDDNDKDDDFYHMFSDI